MAFNTAMMVPTMSDSVDNYLKTAAQWEKRCSPNHADVFWNVKHYIRGTVRLVPLVGMYHIQYVAIYFNLDQRGLERRYICITLST